MNGSSFVVATATGRAHSHTLGLWANIPALLQIPRQVIHLEAWIAIAAVALIFSLFVLVPLGVMIVQSPKLLHDRHYGLFALITFIWTFSVFTLLWITIPMVVAIWVPYPHHP